MCRNLKFLTAKKLDLRKTKLFRDRPSSFCSTYRNIYDITKKRTSLILCRAVQIVATHSKTLGVYHCQTEVEPSQMDPSRTFKGYSHSASFHQLLWYLLPGGRVKEHPGWFHPPCSSHCHIHTNAQWDPGTKLFLITCLHGTRVSDLDALFWIAFRKDDVTTGAALYFLINKLLVCSDKHRPDFVTDLGFLARQLASNWYRSEPQGCSITALLVSVIISLTAIIAKTKWVQRFLSFK
jgi:hypothetical protein